MIKKILLKTVNLYQLILSPAMGSRCRFYPSCSSYFIQAIEKHGVLSGFFCGLKRILKCNPWHSGGVDLP